MNEEMQTRLMAFLDAVESQANSAGQFVIEQTPLVAQEYLSWCFWSSVMLSVAFALLAAVGICSVLFSFRSEDDDVSAVTFIAGFALSIIFGMLTGAAALDAVKVSVAPRVVLLEKVAELANPK